MRHFPLFFVAFICALLPVIGADTKDETHRVRVSLDNGSRLVGTTDQVALDVDLGFERLEIPIQRVQRVDRIVGAQDARHRVHFVNGDVLTGRLMQDSFDLDASFDSVSLPSDLISGIDILDSHAELTVQKGLLLHLSFDCDEDKEILDQSSFDQDMHAEGIKFALVDKRGRVAVFAGRSKINVAHDDSLCPRNLTIGGWLCPTQAARTYEVIAAKTHPGSWDGGYGLYYYPDNTVYFFVNGYHATYVQAKLTLDRWSHVMGVCDDDSIRIYVDGNLIQQASVNQVAASESGNKNMTGGVTRHVDTPLCLGADNSHESWNGLLDDFVLFNRSLDDNEIRSLYRAGGGSDQNPLDSLPPSSLPNPEGAHEDAK